MKIYGIKTCDSVRKARKFMKEHGIDYTFVDFRERPVGEEKIRQWLAHISIDTLFNNRGTTYRTLKLKEKNLTDEEKAAWLAKENMLIKRPVIEYDNQVIVGFDAEKYASLFTK
ncbi:MAG: arsenate reductase family protein [Sulfurospirillum sp.]|nr:MAG: arsenate reductase family protein [Sulfurospirillum sp.]